MKKTFVIATVENRIAGLLNLLISAKRYMSDWHFVIVTQNYPEEQKADLLNHCGKIFGENIDHLMIEFLPDRIGPHRAKMHGLKTIESDIYVILDDDMIVLTKTDFDKMVEVYIEHKDLGLMAGHYARKLSFVKNAVVRDSLRKEPCIGTYGGLMLGKEIRDLLIEKLDGRDILLDDLEWSITAYINGYMQAIYRGSLLVHMIGSSGGFRVYSKSGAHELPNPDLINIRHKQTELDNENAVLYMGSDDLKPLAHELYNQSRRYRKE